MSDKTYRRNFTNGNAEGILNLMHELNKFCFHTSGADEYCDGCCFVGHAPCPLAIFYDKLEEKLGNVVEDD